jgi:hypothetical protein
MIRWIVDWNELIATAAPVLLIIIIVATAFIHCFRADGSARAKYSIQLFRILEPSKYYSTAVYTQLHEHAFKYYEYSCTHSPQCLHTGGTTQVVLRARSTLVRGRMNE